MLDCIIDLSHHNTVADWAAIKESGFVGIIHKGHKGPPLSIRCTTSGGNRP